MSSSTGNEVPWEGRYLDPASDFAELCYHLKQSNPYDTVALEQVMIYFATALWDWNFSQTEIKAAFESATTQLVRYAAGEDRRGDRKKID